MTEQKTYKYQAACGHPSNRSKAECPACARKRYYHSSETVKQKVKDANRKWQSANRGARNAIVHRSQDKYGQRIPPELIELRRAIKRLEKILGEAHKRKRTGAPDQRDRQPVS